MKKYKMNELNRVNTHCSKNGLKWRYRGKFETIEAAVAEAKKWSGNIGVRVTDCETGETVHEEIWEVNK